MSRGTQAPDAHLRNVFRHVAHNHALGLGIVATAPGRATLRLTYRPDLVGNPETGVLHGGAITSLMDATCGAAVFMALPEPRRIATVDLRIDYLKPALPPHDVMAEAECYQLTRHIAFVRGTAYHRSPDHTLASAAGTFMIVQPGASQASAADGRRSS